MNTDQATRPWKGYTLEELRMRRLVNSAMVQMGTERLKITAQDSEGGPVRQWIDRISTLAEYGALVFKAYRMMRKVIAMFR